MTNDIHAVIDRVLGKLFRRERRATACPLPLANISDVSDEWNRAALAYAERRRSLDGRIPTFRVVSLAPPEMHDINLEDQNILVNVSDSTDEWNRFALAYAKNRHLRTNACTLRRVPRRK